MIAECLGKFAVIYNKTVFDDRRVYIGVVGAAGSASVYGILGDQVNLAARSTLVKGFSQEFIIWRPYWRKIKGNLSMKRNRFFIGWQETMDEVKSRLLKLTKQFEKSRGYVVAIHADH